MRNFLLTVGAIFVLLPLIGIYQPHPFVGCAPSKAFPASDTLPNCGGLIGHSRRACGAVRRVMIKQYRDAQKAGK